MVAGRCTDALLEELGVCEITVDGLVGATGDSGCVIEGHSGEVDSLIGAQS